MLHKSKAVYVLVITVMSEVIFGKVIWWKGIKQCRVQTGTFFGKYYIFSIKGLIFIEFNSGTNS